MPATGAKVAYMLGKSTHTPKDLEHTSTNLQYECSTFQNRWNVSINLPFAVGSYNGGPHNMSRWYRGKMGLSDMAESVEYVPYDETRRISKRSLTIQ